MALTMAALRRAARSLRPAAKTVKSIKLVALVLLVAAVAWAVAAAVRRLREGFKKCSKKKFWSEQAQKCMRKKDKSGKLNCAGDIIDGRCVTKGSDGKDISSDSGAGYAAWAKEVGGEQAKSILQKCIDQGKFYDMNKKKCSSNCKNGEIKGGQCFRKKDAAASKPQDGAKPGANPGAKPQDGGKGAECPALQVRKGGQCVCVEKQGIVWKGGKCQCDPNGKWQTTGDANNPCKYIGPVKNGTDDVWKGNDGLTYTKEKETVKPAAKYAGANPNYVNKVAPDTKGNCPDGFLKSSAGDGICRNKCGPAFVYNSNTKKCDCANGGTYSAKARSCRSPTGTVMVDDLQQFMAGLL